MEPRYFSTEDEAVLEIERLAHAHARRRLAADEADDVAHDVVLAVLERLRAGLTSMTRGDLRRLVLSIARRRMVDRLRRRKTGSMRDAAYLQQRERECGAWMSPETRLEADELESFYRRTLARVSADCRRAYLLVREEGLTYRAAGELLGLSVNRVGRAVAAVQREFRRALRAAGLRGDYMRRRPGRAA